MIIRLENNPKIVIRADQNPSTVTGFTYTQVQGSGATTVSSSGVNPVIYTVYSPVIDSSTFVTSSVFSGYTGTTETTLSGLRTDVDTVSGDTSSNTSNISGNTANILQNANDITYISGVTDTKLPTTTFSTYTGTTAPASFLGINALNDYWTSGQTVDYVTGITPTLTWGSITGTLTNQTDLQSALDTKTEPTDFVGSGSTIITTTGNTVTIYSSPTGVNWGGIGGTLSNQTDLQQALDLKLDNSVYQSDMLILSDEIDTNTNGITANTASISTKLDTSLFSTYTGTTAPATYAGLSNFNAHTGDSTIHFTQASINIAQSQVTDLVTDLSNKADSTDLLNYVPATGGTFSGALQGTSLQLSGDLTVDGTMNVVHVENIYTENDFIYMRLSATTALGVGQVSGIAALNVDGSGTTAIVGVTSDGLVRVGWSGDTLQAIATREDSPVNNALAFWDAGNVEFITTGMTMTELQSVSADTTTNTNFIQSLSGTTIGESGGSKIGIPAIGTPTYTTQEQNNRLFASAGCVTDTHILDAGGGTINVSGGSGFIKSSDSDVAELYSFDWEARTGIAIPSGTTRYIGVVYSGGTPAIEVRTVEDWNHDSEFSLGSVSNTDGVLHISDNPWQTTDSISHTIERFEADNGHVSRDKAYGGLIITESADNNRNVLLSAGRLWSRFNKFTIAAKDTSLTDTYMSLYRNGSGWVMTGGLTQWDNQHWDDGTGTLALLNNNYYTNLWWYITNNGVLHMVYGQSQHVSSSLAEAASPPTDIPNFIHEVSILVGRFIIKEGDTLATLVQSAFDTTFTASLASTHNNLAGLNVAPYLHLTSAEYAYIPTISANTSSIGTKLDKNYAVTNISSNTNITSGYANYMIQATATLAITLDDGGGGAIPDGFHFRVNNVGTGTVTFNTGAGGTTIQSRDGITTLSNQFEVVDIYYYISDRTWTISPVLNTSGFVTSDSFTGYTATTNTTLTNLSTGQTANYNLITGNTTDIATKLDISAQYITGTTASGGTVLDLTDGVLTIYSPTGGTGGSESLSGLTDTTITTPSDYDVLQYTGGTWVNQPPVDIFTAVSDGEFLVRSGATIAGVVGIPDAPATIVSKSATYSVVAGDSGKIIECDGTFTITLPDGMATGMRVDFVNTGTGTITIAATTTLQSKDSAVTLPNQYGGASAYHRGSNVWLLVGDLA